MVTVCQENKSCSNVLNFLESLDGRFSCTHKETAAVIKPQEDTGRNKSLGCIFSEKSADETNAVELAVSSFTLFFSCASSWTVLSQE